MYSGIVFDFDGVLYDSEKHWDVIENQYLLMRISDWNTDEYKNLIGKSLPEAYIYLSRRGLELTEEQYTADYHEMAARLYSNMAKPLENVSLLLEELSTLNSKIAIASSSKRVWIDSALKSNEFPISISVIATADDPLVALGKPAPDVYLRAAHLLGEDASKLVAIEDSRSGVTSAKAAGLYCFGLRNGFNDAQDLSAADEIISGYTAESVAKVTSLLV